MPYRESDRTALLESVVHFYKVDRRDLVYLKFVLEAYEGMSTLSTVEPKAGIVRLSIPAGFAEDMGGIMTALATEIPLTEVEFAQEND